MSKQTRNYKLIEDAISGLQLQGMPRELYEPQRYIMEMGGKRMRPLLTLMACELFGGRAEDALPAALGIELFHNFSLVHDDIMDQAPIRRNKPTVHEKWSSHVAILSGDAMLIKAMQQFEKLPVAEMALVLPLFNRTALQVCEGQQFDMNYEQQSSVSITDYIRMIELKTAVLLACSLQIGAILGKAGTSDAALLYDFGKNAGIAFQLQDDLLDVFADPDKFGKQPGGDIISNKKTFLLLKALEVSASMPYKKEELLNWIHAPVSDPVHKVEAVKDIYNTLNIRKLAMEEMNRYYEKGLDALKAIPVSEDKKSDLYRLVEELRIREI
ncbi:MAG: polyprenyl synthetase family protein [Bacteroidia bacterium]